jgi:hypothetical protein
MLMKFMKKETMMIMKFIIANELNQNFKFIFNPKIKLLKIHCNEK